MIFDAEASPSPSGEGLGWGSAGADLGKRAKVLRCDPTEPEKRMWRALSNRQLNGLKFRRQSVIGACIVDFFCPTLGLIVEVDGDTHDSARDVRRDAAAEQVGFRTLRFTNAEVMQNIDGVLTRIAEVARSLPQRASWRLPHPNPSPEGEGLSGR